MDYWKECIAEALDDAGVSASGEQINTIAAWAEGAHDNYGMAAGDDVATANFISDEAIELKQIKAEQEKKRLWECNTRPCKSCTTSGVVQDGWGRDVTCGNCNGNGRTRY